MAADRRPRLSAASENSLPWTDDVAGVGVGEGTSLEVGEDGLYRCAGADIGDGEGERSDAGSEDLPCVASAKVGGLAARIELIKDFVGFA